jgi:hypothetical protein
LQLGKIQASAKKHLVLKFKLMVEEVATYEVENVLVTRNDPKYQTTHHKFKLNLIERTKFTKIDASNIPLNHFDILPFNDILESNREEKIIGLPVCIIYLVVV